MNRERICKVDGCGISHRRKGVLHEALQADIRQLTSRRREDVRRLRMHGDEREASHQGTATPTAHPCADTGLSGVHGHSAYPHPRPRVHTSSLKRHAPTFVHGAASIQCISTRSIAKYCTRECKKRYYKVKRRAMEANAPGMYTWADVTRLWLLFDRCCAYCLTPTPLADIQAEHVEPISRGGANNTSNLLPSCGPCNADKRDLPLAAWAADRERRHLPPVITTWDVSDTRYTHLTGRTSVRMSA